MSTATAPGRTELDWDAYRALERMNASTLVRGIKSMRSLKRAIAQGFPETRAMAFGSQYHTLLLEPDDFERTHCVMPNFALDPENVTNEGKRSTMSSTKWCQAKIAEFEAENAGREVMTRANYDKALCMIEAINADPFAKDLLDSSDKEVTLVGEINGVPCKGRLDLLGGCITDLKGCANAALIPFGRTAANLGYPFKLAFYRELVSQSIGELLPVYIIAAETDGDFDVCVYKVPDIVLENALGQVFEVINGYKAALRTGRWTGVNRGEPYLELYVPNWAMTDEGEVEYAGD